MFSIDNIFDSNYLSAIFIFLALEVSELVSYYKGFHYPKNQKYNNQNLNYNKKKKINYRKINIVYLTVNSIIILFSCILIAFVSITVGLILYLIGITISSMLLPEIIRRKDEFFIK